MVMPAAPIEPMLAKLSRSMPTGDFLYEPKWDGFRCLIFRDGDDLHLQSRSGKDLARYFPELAGDGDRLPGALRHVLPSRIVVDGEIVVPVNGSLDFDALSSRIHPAASRVDLLAEQTPARFIAFDLLGTHGTDVTGLPFSERRSQLEAILDGVAPPVHLTPATLDPDVAQEWFARFEGAGLDGVIAKPLGDSYSPGKRTLFKIKQERTADVVVAGWRQHANGGVGSLMLGLWDGDDLIHVGVASSFSQAMRHELIDVVSAYRFDARQAGDPLSGPPRSGSSRGTAIGAGPGGSYGGYEHHPWIDRGASDDANTSPARGTQETPRGTNRWNAAKDTSWEPLVPRLVAEVAYDQLTGNRFRHSARFRRWRPDREADSCTFDQLEVAPPAELSEIFGASDKA